MNYMRGSKNSNLDVLIYSAAHVLVDDAAEYMQSFDTASVAISKNLDKQVNRTIKKHTRESWWNSIPPVCRKAVAAVMVCCTISFAMLMSVSAIRAEIVSIFTEWYDQYIAIYYVSENTPPTTIEEYREPTLQISGTERMVMVQIDTLNQILYMKDGEIAYTYQQMLMTDESSDIDNEQCTITEMEINEKGGLLFSYTDGTYTLSWSDGEYRYEIVSYLTDHDSAMLIKMAESVG
jgi:hypothetical protein